LGEGEEKRDSSRAGRDHNLTGEGDRLRQGGNSGLKRLHETSTLQNSKTSRDMIRLPQVAWNFLEAVELISQVYAP
jgi:hypothetical protein